jgi:hypothetical protein
VGDINVQLAIQNNKKKMTDEWGQTVMQDSYDKHMDS